MVILEEGHPPQPRCPLCNILVLWRSLNGSHQHIAQCKKTTDQKQRRLAAEEERAVTSRAFSANGRSFEMVNSFRYLCRVIYLADYDWPAVIQNLAKARAVWRRMTRILIREGGRPQVSVFFFKDVAQSVLLFGADTWVVIPYMGRVLVGFQNQMLR